MKYLGLDISTYVGLAWVDDLGNEMGKCVHFPGQVGQRRLQSIAAEVHRILQIWQPDACCIEDYAIGHVSSVVSVVECGTIVRSVVHGMKIPWWVVPPTVLKKWTTGKGNAKKPEMAEAVLKRWNYRSPSDDIVDAYALARMCQLGEEKLLSIKGVHHGT